MHIAASSGDVLLPHFLRRVLYIDGCIVCGNP